jgi:hypothetical protein
VLKQNKKQSAAFYQSPNMLYLFAAICVVLVVVITPERLIDLGPMRGSLTSIIESVRKVAYLEVLMLRILLFILAVSSVCVALYWEKITHSALVAAVNTHIPVDTTHCAQSKIPNYSLLIIIACTLVGLLYMAFGPELLTTPQMKMIHDEDGMIESLTVVFLLVACLLSALLAYRWSHLRARLIVHSLLAFLFFVMAGEEISWGQRIFGLDTPEVIKQVNVQGEINLHNLLGYFSDHIFIVAIFLYGVVLPGLTHFNLFCRKLFDLLGLPVASMGLAIGFFIASLIHSWVIHRFIEPPFGFRVGELRELVTVLALMLLMVETWQLVPKQQTHQHSQ